MLIYPISVSSILASSFWISHYWFPHLEGSQDQMNDDHFSVVCVDISDIGISPLTIHGGAGQNNCHFIHHRDEAYHNMTNSSRFKFRSESERRQWNDALQKNFRLEKLFGSKAFAEIEDILNFFRQLFLSFSLFFVILCWIFRNSKCWSQLPQTGTGSEGQIDFQGEICRNYLRCLPCFVLFCCCWFCYCHCCPHCRWLCCCRWPRQEREAEAKVKLTDRGKLVLVSYYYWYLIVIPLVSLGFQVEKSILWWYVAQSLWLFSIKN